MSNQLGIKIGLFFAACYLAIAGICLYLQDLNHARMFFLGFLIWIAGVKIWSINRE